MDFSVVTPYGARASSCGYCKSSAGSRSFGIEAHFITPVDYQKLMNRGWRRSGKYLYKPNLRDSCCPQYTIRMEAKKYEASKHQRQIVNRFNTYVREGDDNFEKDIQSRMQRRSEEEKSTSNGGSTSTSVVAEAAGAGAGSAEVSAPSSLPTDASTTMSVAGKKPKQKRPPKNAPTDLKSRIHSSEYLLSPDVTFWKHRLRVCIIVDRKRRELKAKIKLEPSSFTQEKYELFVKYQMEVHHEQRSRCQPSGFTNFLVSSPITPTKEKNWKEEDPGFGSFHQCYYLDGKLIAVSVIDILPQCVSAVYFYYDTDYSVLSLGKYSAQREIALVQTLNAKPGYEDVEYYYLGLYIFTCPKMAYKAQFHPSYLLDPETYNWVEFKKCQEILNGQRYSSFENPTALDPLFEAKIQAITAKKKGSNELENTSASEEEDDDWESMEEEDEEQDLDPDEFSDKALEDRDQDDKDRVKEGGERKKKRLNKESSLATKDGRDTAAEAKAADHAKKQEMERKFQETIKSPPPGCLNPKHLTLMDLSGVLCLTGQNALRPIVATDMYRDVKEVQKVVKEYFAQVGEEIGNSLVLYLR
ncbi:Arginyl-tRNA--protein transferase 1 [Mortierella claussenii]|nr:Arginyl-tRNA--protein transferase 1 [Mortierella claussenii]